MMSEVQNSILPNAAPEVNFFCGFDWARNDHYFVLKDRSHRVLDEGYFENSADGFQNFFGRLDAHRNGEPVALIIEGNRGSAMTVLSLVPWITLYPVNPSKTRKLNELDGSGRGKDDPRDSHLLCDHLIANYQKLRAENECDTDILCLRELVQSEEELIGDCTRFKCRIMAQISHFCPGLADIVSGKLDKEAYTEYLLRFDPRQPASDATIKKHLKKYHVRGSRVVEKFLEKHRALQVLPMAKELLAIHVDKLDSLVRQLQAIQKELCSSQSEISALFATLPNAEIYLSLPGLGERLAPRMAALFGKNPEKNYANKHEVNAYFGQSPVTESSGGKDKKRKQAGEREKKQVNKRRSCNRFARQTTYLWSGATARLREVNAPWQRAFLQRCKDRGDKTATRYRKLGKKMLAILYTCLVTEKRYSEEVYLSNVHSKC